MEQKENQAVIDNFKKRKNKQLIASAPLIAAIVPLVLMDDSAADAFMGIPSSILLPICIIVVFSGLIFSLFNWRCPACNGYLGKRFSPKFCAKCGVQLQ